MNGLRPNRIKYLIASVAVVVLAASGCSHKAGDDDQGSFASETIAHVTLTRVSRTDISRTFALTGTAAALPNKDVKVSALVPGRLAELKLAEGDAVTEGQILARLDDRTYRDQLLQAEAAQQQAQANLENAKLSHTRNQDLFQRGIAARKDLEDAQTQASVAAAAVRQADAALEIARLNLARCEIVSPLNGIVAKRFVSVGEQVDGTAVQPIVEVANLAEVEFLGNAPAVYLAKMHPGEGVDVVTEAVPGQKFPGRVVATAPSIDPSTGVGFVRIRVPNQHAVLRLGMFLSAEISVDTHRHVFVVPVQSIYKDEESQPRVFVVNQDAATAVKVELGIETTDRVELVDADGLKEGDNIILTGGYGLGDKAKVQVQPSSDQ
jgi:RND family efflux transporter MFP subunit